MAKPVISSNGSPLPPRSYQRRGRLSAYGIAYTASSLRSQHILPRRRPERVVPPAAEFPWSRSFFTGALAEPLEPVGPPRAPALGGFLQPLVGRLGIALAGLVARALVAGRIDHRSDVAARREDEARLRAEQSSAAVAVLPRRDVV